jgi:hypothetical protein
MIEIIKKQLQTESFWKTIIQDTISGVSIGLTIAIIGYFIWKKQNLYSKKFDVYINVISAVNEIYSVTWHSITVKKNPILNKFHELDNGLLLELRKNKLLFVAFFGKKYNDKIEYFININKHLERVEITIKKDGGTFTQFYKPEEYTPDILNIHKQDVINKMHEYIKELELVSKGLKRYALLKK